LAGGIFSPGCVFAPILSGLRYNLGSDRVLESKEIMSTADKMRRALAEMQSEYASAEHKCPWIVGFSGGKDSTLVVQFVFEMLLSLAPSDRERQVIVLSNDTLVESPILKGHLDRTLEKIQEGADSLRLPIKTVKTQPDVDQTFWVNLIGRGYPAPNRQFRWCTDRMKIQPTSKFILSEVNEFGEVILVLGVRSTESATRAQVAAKYSAGGQRLHKHSDLPGCLVFRPILDFTTDEVWQVLLQRNAAWGGKHTDLVTLYRNAEGGECPLVIDQSSAPSCGTGSSRFGCWTCTVVTKDKSMEGLIDAGFDYLEPLLEFRDWLQSIRDHRDYRQTERRNGEPGIGPFTLDARRKILDRLLSVQENVKFPLISDEEIARIHSIWADDTVVAANRLFAEYRKVAEKDREEHTAAI
jgi:DNA sulfur modification protein DndC